MLIIGNIKKKILLLKICKLKIKKHMNIFFNQEILVLKKNFDNNNNINISNNEDGKKCNDINNSKILNDYNILKVKYSEAENIINDLQKKINESKNEVILLTKIKNILESKYNELIKMINQNNENKKSDTNEYNNKNIEKENIMVKLIEESKKIENIIKHFEIKNVEANKKIQILNQQI